MIKLENLSILTMENCPLKGKLKNGKVYLNSL
jgi:hypothetical protein